MSFRRNNINLVKHKESSFGIFRIIKIIIFIMLILGIFSFFSYSNFVSNFKIEKNISITIEKTDRFSNLGNKIEQFDNIWYKFYLRDNMPDFELMEGNYKIKAGSNLEETLKALDKPIYEEATITILEGWNIFDIDYYLEKKGYINSGEYINYVRNKEKIKALSKFFPFLGEQETLEGFLYPDTYKINAAKFKINEFVIQQLENFEVKVYNKLFLVEGKQIHSNEVITDVVNLASIVEKEERNPKEKSTVAGILKKRLNSGWKIGADITVCYPYNLTSEECKMVVTKYLYEKNDYNTREKVGLPRTPIGNPNYESINATLNHKETEYWFYLHNVTSGKIFYAKDNVGHERNKRLYMR